jgi:hypothetical protein
MRLSSGRARRVRSDTRGRDRWTVHGDRAAECGRAGPAVLIVILLAFGAGLAAWWQYTHRPAPRTAEVPPPGAVERALAQAAADSLALKTKWVGSVPDIDATVLDPAQHERFVRFVNARFCECGCGYTLGACRNYDPTCEFSGPLVAVLFDSIRAGHPFDLEGIRPRPGAPGE